MKKYPSTEQFRNIVKKVREKHDYKENGVYTHTSNYPTLTFKGTIKLHGTNAGIIKYKDRIEFQSRERVLSLTDDNSGFMHYYANKNLDFLFDNIDFDEYVAVYGEWCGGNIQKGVALNRLEKMFVIFSVDIDGTKYDASEFTENESINVYNINTFQTFYIDIDFEKPELSQNTIISLTRQVENECPVGKHFGVSGIGEGIVFTSVLYPSIMFKSKGQKHSVTKVKKLNSIDVEILKTINEFAEYSVTEARLKQGLDYFKENNIIACAVNTGNFIKWIVADIFKEETDTIEASKLSTKQISGAIVNKARVWYLNNI